MDSLEDVFAAQLDRVRKALSVETESEKYLRKTRDDRRRSTFEQMEFEQGFGDYMGHVMGPRRPTMSSIERDKS